LQPSDELAIAAVRLDLMALELLQQRFDPIDGGQDERDSIGGDRPAAAKARHEKGESGA
jgi:hypothetical protein